MTVKDLIKVCSKEDYACVYDIATDTYLYGCIFISSLVLM